MAVPPYAPTVPRALTLVEITELLRDVPPQEGDRRVERAREVIAAFADARAALIQMERAQQDTRLRKEHIERLRALTMQRYDDAERVREVAIEDGSWRENWGVE